MKIQFNSNNKSPNTNNFMMMCKKIINIKKIFKKNNFLMTQKLNIPAKKLINNYQNTMETQKMKMIFKFLIISNNKEEMLPMKIFLTRQKDRIPKNTKITSQGNIINLMMILLWKGLENKINLMMI